MELAQKNQKIIDKLDLLSDLPEDINYVHSLLCQVAMPLRQTNEKVFERTSGNASLLLKAGQIWKNRTWQEKSLPYGPKPRLIMIYLVTEAIQKRTPIIDVGGSMRQFMNLLGSDTNGRNYKVFNHQLECLVACDLYMGLTRDDSEITAKVGPINRFKTWLHPDISNSDEWPGVIELSPEFYETLINHAVPLPREVLLSLKDSALCLDVYSWLAYRLRRVKTAQGDWVPWNAVKFQFGPEYDRMDNFKKRFLIALKYAKALYKDANINVEPEGLRLYESFPPINDFSDSF